MLFPLVDEQLRQQLAGYIEENYQEPEPVTIHYSIYLDYKAAIEKRLAKHEETFAEMLFRKINEKGMTDAQCYKKAHLNRKLFSKFRTDPYYHPSRDTVFALGIALELPLEEFKDFLGKACYAFTDSHKEDVIVTFFIEKGIYDLYLINEALEDFEELPLGRKRRLKSCCHRIKKKLSAEE